MLHSSQFQLYVCLCGVVRSRHTLPQGIMLNVAGGGCAYNSRRGIQFWRGPKSSPIHKRQNNIISYGSVGVVVSLLDVTACCYCLMSFPNTTQGMTIWGRVPTNSSPIYWLSRWPYLGTAPKLHKSSATFPFTFFFSLAKFRHNTVDDGRKGDEDRGLNHGLLQ